MLIRKFSRLHNTDDASGGASPAPVDRGDLLEPEVPAEVPAADVSADPAVKKLEGELKVGDTPAEGADPAVADEAAAAADADSRKDSRIPESRHKAILEKERARTAAALTELAQLKQRGNLAVADSEAGEEVATLEASVLTMEEEYATLLTDGEIKKATAVMAKIRAAERRMSDVKADLKINAATVQASEASNYNTALSSIEKAYPALNPDHDDYNAAIETRVIRLSRANQADGMTRTAALQDAVETILGTETPQQEQATAKPTKDVAGERKAAAVDKVAKAIAKTPPSLAQTGLDSDKAGGGAESAQAVINMSQKEFAKLSDEALAKLRGDTL